MARDARPEQYVEAKRLFNSQRFEEARAIYADLAASGDVRSQVFLGWMYLRGTGAARDLQAAAQYFEAAANLGSKEGAFYLGRLYAQDHHYSEARKWFERASASEYGPALFWLGHIYQRGLGTDTDLNRAAHYYERAARQGNLFARRNLAVLMIRGAFGYLKIPVGLVLFPYFAIVATCDAIVHGYTDKLIA